MLKIKRIITDNAFSYEDVEFMDWKKDQDSIGIGNYITDDSLKQIAIKTKDGKVHVITDWMVGVLQLRKFRVTSGLERIDRLVINGEISYGPVHLIPISKYHSFNVPRVFEHQFTFAADGWLYICDQSAIIQITK